MASLTATPAFAFQNEPSGFRGIAWGTPLSNVADQMVVAHPDTEKPGDMLASYTRRGDLLNIEGVALKSITYMFLDGKFASVFIVSAPATADAMSRVVQARFGSGVENRWDGDTARISLECIPTPLKFCDLSMVSKKYFDEVMQAPRP